MSRKWKDIGGCCPDCGSELIKSQQVRVTAEPYTCVWMEAHCPERGCPMHEAGQRFALDTAIKNGEPQTTVRILKEKSNVPAPGTQGRRTEDGAWVH